MILDPTLQEPSPEHSPTTELIHFNLCDIDGNLYPAIMEIQIDLMEVTVTNITCQPNVLYSAPEDDINDAIKGRYKYAEIQPYKL